MLTLPHNSESSNVESKFYTHTTSHIFNSFGLSVLLSKLCDDVHENLLSFAQH